VGGVVRQIRQHLGHDVFEILRRGGSDGRVYQRQEQDHFQLLLCN